MVQRTFTGLVNSHYSLKVRGLQPTGEMWGERKKVPATLRDHLLISENSLKAAHQQRWWVWHEKKHQCLIQLFSCWCYFAVLVSWCNNVSSVMNDDCLNTEKITFCGPWFMDQTLLLVIFAADQLVETACFATSTETLNSWMRAFRAKIKFPCKD